MENKDNPCRHGDTSSCIQPNFKAVHTNPVTLTEFCWNGDFNPFWVYYWLYQHNLINPILHFTDYILKFTEIDVRRKNVKNNNIKIIMRHLFVCLLIFKYWSSTACCWTILIMLTISAVWQTVFLQGTTKESFQTGFQGTITSRDLEQIQEKKIFNVYSAFFSVDMTHSFDRWINLLLLTIPITYEWDKICKVTRAKVYRCIA